MAIVRVFERAVRAQDTISAVMLTMLSGASNVIEDAMTGSEMSKRASFRWARHLIDPLILL